MADEIRDSVVRRDKQASLPFLAQLSRATTIYSYKLLGVPTLFYRDWFYPSEFPPNLIKTYDSRPFLPIRIFFPKTYELDSSHELLPTVFTIHGGGFCLGRTQDDDEWNARFASMHSVLVIALNYRKAPNFPFPTATYDLEALILAAFNDESLPIDKNHIAIGGFSAGGNLSLSVSQLPSIREKVKPAAVLAIYGVVDMTVSLEDKVKMRYYKPGLAPGLRGSAVDFLAGLSPAFQWSYISPGVDLGDPLLSPYFAPRENLPPHLFFIGTELDQLAHGTWRMASKIAGRPIPTWTDKPGQEGLATKEGELILDDERFAFEKVEDGGKKSVRWLLVPDQVHGFDHLPHQWLGEAAVKDGKLKEVAYSKILGDWLREVVWK
ncbi:alpha/beta-hydrolase [Hypoxylon trugodes]|uniref:alpha/beta-hydrolase n=1 Tax=Hypoxylon trugodes TaxID=326681 RepID=UPI00219D6C1B|nr:alpha/beta-hydrolase [Hypoxylon trugodes]KAI1387585.1 alpha/beta-hydrolase [Hypoxylon trugodes]